MRQSRELLVEAARTTSKNVKSKNVKWTDACFRIRSTPSEALTLSLSLILILALALALILILALALALTLALALALALTLTLTLTLTKDLAIASMCDGVQAADRWY